MGLGLPRRFGLFLATSSAGSLGLGARAPLRCGSGPAVVHGPPCLVPPRRCGARAPRRRATRRPASLAALRGAVPRALFGCAAPLGPSALGPVRVRLLAVAPPPPGRGPLPASDLRRWLPARRDGSRRAVLASPGSAASAVGPRAGGAGRRASTAVGTSRRRRARPCGGHAAAARRR